MLRVVATIILVSFSAVSAIGAEEDRRTISTSGEAAVNVVPNEAIVSFGVQVVDPDLAKAKAKVEAQSAKLSSAVKAMGIEQRYFATDNVQVSLIYDQYHGQSRGTTVTGYLVTRSYSVTLKDIEKLEPLVDTILTNGANMLDGVQMRSTEMRRHRDNARLMAIRAAKEKAEALAGELNCSVGSPRSITDSVSYWNPQRSARSSSSYQNVTQEESSNEVVEGEALPLGQIGITATVNVVFDLVPGSGSSTADALTTATLH